MSNLTLPAREKALNSLQDLLNSNYHQIMFKKGYIATGFFSTSKEGLVKKVWEKALKQDQMYLDPAIRLRDFTKHPEYVYPLDANGAKVAIQVAYSNIKGK